MIKITQVHAGEDLEQVRILFGEYADELGLDLSFQNFEQELSALPGEYAPPRGILLIAKYRGEVAGCVAVRSIEHGICEMKRLFVRPQYRGFGIGRALAESAISKAREIGYHHTCLDTLPAMEKARALYESLGFKRTTPYYHSLIPGTVFLELNLGILPRKG